jgi:hypothetical protein
VGGESETGESERGGREARRQGDGEKGRRGDGETGEKGEMWGKWGECGEWGQWGPTSCSLPLAVSSSLALCSKYNLFLNMSSILLLSNRIPLPIPTWRREGVSGAG